MSKLSDTQIEQLVDELQFNWQAENGVLTLEVKTKNFADSLWAVTEIGKIAEDMNHHPDLEIRNFNNLTIAISTHEVGGLTEQDFRFAERVDSIITRIQNHSLEQ